MARTEIAGFPPQTYKTLQSEARKNAISQRKIKDMGLFRANYGTLQAMARKTTTFQRKINDMGVVQGELHTRVTSHWKSTLRAKLASRSVLGNR